MERVEARNVAPPLREWRFWLLIASVVGVAAPQLVHLLTEVRVPGVHAGAFTVVAVLVLASELLPLVTVGNRIPGGMVVSRTFVFAILLHWGIALAVLVRIVGVLLWAVLRRWSPWRAVFNVAQFTLALSAANLVLAAYGRDATPDAPLGITGADLPAFVTAAATFFVVNSALVYLAIAVHQHRRLSEVVRAETTYHAVSTAALLALSPLVVLTVERSPALVPLMLVPLLAVRQVGAASVRQEQAALHDPLTGLGNRVLLVTLASDAIRRAAGAGTSVALLLLDLDRFKEVNDALGHSVGDELLRMVGRRLSAAVSQGDTVVRLGGDEFGILLTGLPGRPAEMLDRCEEVARQITALFQEPFVLEGLEIGVGASIGIAAYPLHGSQIDTLLSRADVALYVSKDGPSTYAIYSAETDRNSASRLALLGDLRRALMAGGNGQGPALTLHYQPQLALATGQVVGAEALVRWQHPTRGLLLPSEFLPRVGHGALVHELTRQVLDLALTQQQQWRQHGVCMAVAVNLTAWDLHDPDLPCFLGERLRRYQVRPAQITLEITETAVMADATRVLATLHALDDLGVSISLDDFGTGYASLSHLRRLPVREVKIDRSFVSRMETDADDAAVVRSIIELGHALGLRVVAEGVEDEATRQHLAKLGCTEAQGWYFSPPLPAGELIEWVTGRPHRRHPRGVGQSPPWARHDGSP